VAKAETLHESPHAITSEPSVASLEDARSAWLAARDPYAGRQAA
jgi:uncharacterized iron-regulated protein